MTDTPRDHGGNLDAAIETYGGAPDRWIDLSTGINRVPYPVATLSPRSWTALPTGSDLAHLSDAARRAYGTSAPIVPLAGAQAAIQLAPRLSAAGTVRILGPTYNEHAAAFGAQGWRVEQVGEFDALGGTEAAVVVNPNNPDGCHHAPEALTALAGKTGLLIVDESFADPTPALSVATKVPDNTVVLRSFGKYYGLAGIRLGFAIAQNGLARDIAELAGPWAASGPAIALGTKALADTGWQDATTTRLIEDAARLDQLALSAGWTLVGGTALFRTYQTPGAIAAQTHLARHHIWSRVFSYHDQWLRLGLPAPDEWSRVEGALSS